MATGTKDSFHAKIAFYLSLGFWIPLFNIALCIIAGVLAIKAMKDYFRNPNKYGGLGYSIAALVLSITSIVFTVIGIILYLYSDSICMSAVCQAVLN